MADEFKLDILLEDYLEQARVWNDFFHEFNLLNNISTRIKMSPMPTIDPSLFIHIPHRARLDLSVLLTASIMFDLPKPLFKETLFTLVSQYLPHSYLSTLIQLPLFVKTALVSLIRRLCRKELEEIEVTKKLSLKPPLSDMPSFDFAYYKGTNIPPPTFQGVNGYYHLRTMKYYLALSAFSKVNHTVHHTVGEPDASTKKRQPYYSSSAYVLHATKPFSELEMEVMTELPNVPTKANALREMRALLNLGSWNGPMDDESMSPPKTPDYLRWTSFCARHAVLLLTRASSCPPINRSQTNSVHQEVYKQLLPILKHAKLTIGDLDIPLTGPNEDGRVLSTAQLTKAVGPRNAALYEGQLVLPFGVGLPVRIHAYTHTLIHSYTHTLIHS